MGQVGLAGAGIHCWIPASFSPDGASTWAKELIRLVSAVISGQAASRRARVSAWPPVRRSWAGVARQRRDAAVVSYRVPAAGAPPEIALRRGASSLGSWRSSALPDVRTGAGSDLDRLLHSVEAKDFLRQGYDPMSPDGPEHFGVYAKTMTMIDSEPEIDLAKLAAVSALALVLQGDRGEVTLKHGPRLPRLWEMAGLRCFRARTACRSNCPKSSTRCSSRSLRGACCSSN